MKIVADENIRYVEEAFSPLGDVVTLPGREIGAHDVADAELLLVRSVTEVDEMLLEGSAVQFVGTATIGMDHIDREYLDAQNIAFSSAAGSNANSVAEYVVSALLALANEKNMLLEGASLGVIGVGNVGSRVVEKADVLGMKTVLNDPPLARKTQEEKYRPLDEALQCDFVTVHVPLTRTGPDATHRMVDSAFLDRIRRGGVLLNTSRGDVVDEKALLQAVENGELSHLCLDVWAGEPNISPAMLRATTIGTPHIAGYSLDGKTAGTAMICEAACEFLELPVPVDVMSLLPEPVVPSLTVKGLDAPQKVIRDVVFQVYNVRDDDRKLRRLLDRPVDRRGAYFADLRRDYPPRREFYNTELDFRDCAEEIREKLLGLGFSEA